MYIISKFESFSNQPDIEEIKDIFQDLVDKWDMVKNSRNSKDIKYAFNIDDRIPMYHTRINIGKYIEKRKNKNRYNWTW